jgi:MoaA/NifB/PqqE/SkfB family radical SAM enzyme
MEPTQQMEIQLGHMCNNRCVFCVSGQRTARREAFPLEADPILSRIRDAWDSGMRKLTLLGGEPTIQPEFMNILRTAVGLGFEEIVIFTNGVKTARPSFMDEVLATGGNFTFRFSFQGANREAHERTTKKDGSFGRLVESLKNAHTRGQRVTVNMCVVRSNYESVADFPALILPYGARQLHLDMIRPLDAGERTEEEMRGMLPRYSDMVPYLEKMIAGFPPGFDVNIGNLPYCIAPQLARWIHHDGEQTFTVAIDEKDTVSEPWNKYEVKRRDKVKRDACGTCVFDAKCSGVFETYRDFYGVDELVPITRERLAEVDPEFHLFALHLEPALAAVAAWKPPEPFGPPAVRVESVVSHEAVLSFPGPAGAVVVALRRPGPGGIAATRQFTMHLLEAPDAGPFTLKLLRSLFEVLARAGATTVVHPVGEDAAFQAERPPRLGALLDMRLGSWLRFLRTQAPFGALSWKNVAITGAGKAATLSLVDSAGAEAAVTLTVKGTQIGGAYKLLTPGMAPSPELVEGLRALFGVLRAPSSSATPVEARA